MPIRCARGTPKKLRAAARAWVTPPSGSGKADEEDANADAIKAYLAKRSAKAAGEGLQPKIIEIAPDEADVVALFIALQTQWNIHAMTGVRTGLMYEAIPATASMCGIVTNPGLFADLRCMESAAMEEMANSSGRFGK